MRYEGILLDTSFFIRLLNEEDALHQNVLRYFRYFLEKKFILKISTISIAEYCVKGEIDELPLKDVQILPFNIDHAVQAGRFAALVFEKRQELYLPDRRIIPNDTKLFAQADTDAQIQYFVTSDNKCIKIFDLIAERQNLRFGIINIAKPFDEALSNPPFK